jgi:hypothetical protein
MNKTIKFALIGIAAALIGYGMFYSSRHSISDKTKVQTALENLLKESPENNSIYNVVSAKFTIQDGVIDKQGDLAHTEVKSNGSITITVDVNEVSKYHDRLEPVIAHELLHAYDALTLGIDKFIEIANSEKSKDWKERSLEIHAIAWENTTRQYLIAHYPKEYRSMRPTRQLQNQISH